MRTLTILAATGGLLLGAVSCGVIAAVLPPTLPLGATAMPVGPIRTDASRAVFTPTNFMASSGAVVDSVMDRIESPGVGGTLAVSAGGPLTVEVSVRSTLEGCSAVPDAPAWTCPVTDAERLGTVQVSAGTVTPLGPWYGEGITRAVRGSALYVGLRVVSGTAPDTATLTATLDLHTR